MTTAEIERVALTFARLRSTVVSVPEYDLDEWRAVINGDSAQPSDDYIVIAFPDDKIREEYLSSLGSRSDAEVRRLLRTWLAGSEFSILDEVHFQALQQRYASRAPQDSFSFTEYEARLILNRSGKSQGQTLPGVAWALELLPNRPADAIAVVSYYLSAHYGYLSDWKIVGLTDAMTVIRYRYIIEEQQARDNKVELLRSLPPRNIEFLVAALYDAYGYDVEVTPERKDGGKDVIARKGRTEMIYIECKNWEEKASVDTARALYGVATKDGATRAVLVSISGFTDKGPETTTEFIDEGAERPFLLDLVDGSKLVELLNERFGSNWHLHVDRLITAKGGKHQAP